MKNFLKKIGWTGILIVTTMMAYGATSTALYLHHQQSTLAALEADLQNREIGLDFANKTAVGKFADGTKFHLISQEEPSVALTGNLSVSGNTTLSSNVTLPLQTINRPMWTNGSSQITTTATTGTGTTLMLNASPSVSGTLAAANGTYSGTLTATGDITISNATSVGASLRVISTDVGGTDWRIASGGSAGGAFPTGSLTFRNATSGNNWLTIGSSGAVAVPGTLAVTSTTSLSQSLIFAANGTGGTGRIYRDATNGLVVRGVAGSTYDILVASAAGNVFIGNPTGTNTIVTDGALSFTGNGAAGAASLFKDATNGIVLRAATGSARDMQIQSQGGTVVMQIPTGTTTTQFPNAVQFTSGTGVSFTTAPNFPSVTASQILSVDGSKNLTSIATTGSGSVMLAASPATTGTLTAASITATGAVAANGSLTIPANSTPETTLGRVRLDTTKKTIAYYDGTREQMGNLGWAPYAVPIGFSVNGTYTTVLSLPANGGSVAFPIHIPSKMMAKAYYLYNTDAAAARSYEIALYVQYQQTDVSAENTLAQVSGSTCSESYTASVGSNRSCPLGASIFLAPGTYWMVIRNTHATNTWGFGTSTAGTYSLFTIQTKTIGSSLSSTLDMATSWSQNSSEPGAMIRGRVFGDAFPGSYY